MHKNKIKGEVQKYSYKYKMKLNIIKENENKQLQRTCYEIKIK